MKTAPVSPARRLRGAKARDAGHAGEWSAAAWLMLKGWRILAMRLKTPGAEIDLLARRGGVLAVVEVKRRATRRAALEALSSMQAQRLIRAGEAYAARRPALAALAVRLDLVALAPGRLPRHVPGVDA